MSGHSPSSPKTGTCLAICLAVVLAWFSPWWAGGKNLAPLDLQHEMMQPWRGGGEPGVAKNHFISDNIDVIMPYHLFAAKSYHREGWVGWSDLTYGGTAQYANTMALYDDWTMQLYRWFDFWTAWHLGLMGQVMLAASGMVLFLKGRKVDGLWCVCGGLMYAANSQFVTWIDHRFALGPFCWVPWIFWAIDVHRSGRRWGWMAVPPFIALAFLGGTLQHVAMVALAVMACWLEEAWALWKGAEKRVRPGQVALFGRYAAWGILGAGISGLMLIPCTEALYISNKLGLHHGLYATAKQSIYTEGILQPLFNAAAYPLQIFPSLLGRSDSMDVLKLFKSNLFFVAYIGTLPTLIAYLSIWRKDTGMLAKVLILVGLLLPLTPAVRYLYQRLLLLFLLGGTIAFASWMNNSTDETRRKTCKWTGWTAGILAVVHLLVSGVMWFFGQGFLESLRQRAQAAAVGSSFAGSKDWLQMRAQNFVGDLFIWSPQQAIPLVLLALALWGLGWTASRIEVRRKMGAVLLTSAIVLEVTVFAARWVVWADPVKHPLFPETPEVAALRENVGRYGRITTLDHPTRHMSSTPFIPNTSAAYGIASITGYDSVVPHGMVLPNETPGDAEKLGRFGVTHLITWLGNPDVPTTWKFLWKSPSMELYENPHAMSRYVAFRSDSARNNFFAGRPPEALPLDEKTGYQNWREIDVPAGSESIRVAENHGDGWQFRMSPGSEWKPVERAPDASMLIRFDSPLVKQGTVEMRYHPPLRTAGFIVTGLSLAIVAGAGIWFMRKPVAS